MNLAQQTFNVLVGFKNVLGDGRSSQQQLLDYCRDVLSSVEKMHFDYKTKRNKDNAKLEDPDKATLAKAISGFANSSGGVLIWGIKNGVLTPEPIADIKDFTEALGQIAWQATDPPVRDIAIDWIPAEPLNQGRGFALIYIPESALPPHRVNLNVGDIKNHYYIRTAESFIVASHVQLEDMFGRRPRPVVSLATRIEVQRNGTEPNFRYSFSVILGISNEGRGVARAPFISLEINPQPLYHVNINGLNGNGQEGLNRLITSPQVKVRQYGASSDIIVYPGMVHDVTSIAIDPPRGELEDMKDLIIDWQIVAEGIQLVKDRTVITWRECKDAIRQYVSEH